MFVPGGANGVAAKLNSPNIYVYADNNGLVLADLSRFNVILHCSMSLSHSVRGKLGSTIAKPALKWFLNVCMTLSAKFCWCVCGVTSWYDV